MTVANNPFDRMIVNLREKPLSSDINRAESQADYSLRFMMREMFAKRAETTVPVSPNSNPATGFVGTGFRVSPAASPNMTVTVKGGLGMIDDPANSPSAIGGVIGTDDLSSYKPVVLMQDTVLTVPTADGANQRFDLIEVRYNRVASDPQTRQILDPLSGAFSPNVVQKTLQNTVDGSVGAVVSPALSTSALSYKQGIAAASPVVPATTPGYVAVAIVTVLAGATSIDLGQVSDMRPFLVPGGVAYWGGTWRLQWNAGVPIATCLRLNAPPGVTVVLWPSPVGALVRGAFDMFVAGGLMRGATCVANVGTTGASLPAGEMLTVSMELGISSTSDILGGVLVTGNGFQAGRIATGAPPSPIGTQAFYSQFGFRPRHQVGATTSVTNVALEDLSVDVAGVIRW